MVLKSANAHNARPFLVAIMATLIAVLATATVSGGWASAQTGGTDGTGSGGTGTGGTGPIGTTPTPDPETPQGQLVRRGLSGKVVSKGEASFVVETRHGNVEVLVTGETTFRKPPEGLVSFDELEVGDKVGVLLAKADSEISAGAETSATDAEAVIRTATALKVLIVPGHSTRKHVRAVVLEKVRGHINVIDRNGHEREIEVDVEIEGEAGSELILVTQESKNGDGLKLRASVRARVIEERLDRISEKREDLKERLKDVRERVAEKRAEAIERVKDRLDDANVDAEVKAKIRAATDEIKLRLEARIEEAKENHAEKREERQEKKEEARNEHQDAKPEDSSNRHESSNSGSQDDSEHGRNDTSSRHEKEDDGGKSGDQESKDSSAEIHIEGRVEVGR